MERVRFITHGGKRVLLVDHTDSTPEEMTRTLSEVEQIIAAAPPNSLLTLSDFTRAQFDRDAADRLKVVAAKDRPHVHRAAFVGSESIPDVYYRNLEAFSVRRFPRFSTREEALDWLTRENTEAAAS